MTRWALPDSRFEAVVSFAQIGYTTAGSGFGLVAGADFKSVGGQPRVVCGGFDSLPFRLIFSDVDHERYQ